MRSFVRSRPFANRDDFEQLKKSIHNALKQWHNLSTPSNGRLQELHIFEDMLRETGGEVRGAINLLLVRTLDALETRFEQDATLIRRSFLDNEVNHRIAADLNIAEATLYRWQNDALDRLVTALSEIEQDAQASNCSRLIGRLELPTYQSLIGVDTHLDNLVDVVLDPDSSWLIAIEGMGGIGKTSMADALMRRMIHQYVGVEIGWVTARREFFNLGGAITERSQPVLSTDALIDALVAQLVAKSNLADGATPEQRLATLQNLLESRPHTIVIDNLETVSDIEELLPVLRRLANPTKFILTSRQNLFTEADIHHFALPELSESDALVLIRQEAKQRNLVSIFSATDDDLRPIVETVGGNPLALRLVVGQTHFYGLNKILTDLQSARSEKVENLYYFIYRQAWDHLSEIERKVFVAMPMVVQEGGTLDYLEAMTQLDPNSLTTALERLVSLNLVDSIGGLQERRFSIHNLTRTFLHEQVIRWH